MEQMFDIHDNNEDCNNVLNPPFDSIDDNMKTRRIGSKLGQTSNSEGSRKNDKRDCAIDYCYPLLTLTAFCLTRKSLNKLSFCGHYCLAMCCWKICVKFFESATTWAYKLKVCIIYYISFAWTSFAQDWNCFCRNRCDNRIRCPWNKTKNKTLFSLEHSELFKALHPGSKNTNNHSIF